MNFQPSFLIIWIRSLQRQEVTGFATTLAMQDFSQLVKDYGKEQADVIVNITGNIISGQVTGDTAKKLSERFGKIMQDRESISINRTDTSISKSKQLDYTIPSSKISSPSSSKFVGMVADDPNEKIKLKMFHAEIQNDAEKLNEEAKHYKPIPQFSNVNSQQVMDNYFQIKLDVKTLIEREVKKLKSEVKIMQKKVPGDCNLCSPIWFHYHSTFCIFLRKL
jgi:hypothetical protein